MSPEHPERTQAARHADRTPGAAGLAGVGLVVLASACFATLGPVTRFASEAGVESLGFAAWRAGIGGVVMVALLAVRYAMGRRELVGLAAVPTRARLILLLAGVAGATLNLAIFIAFVRISIGLALLVFYLYPALVALASVIWFRERLDAPRWAALGLSLAGMVLVVSGPMGSLDLIGIGLAFVAAVSQTVYVLSVRHGFGTVPSIQASTFFLVFAALAYTAFALATGNAEAVLGPMKLPDAWLLLLFAGTLGAGLPTVAYMAGIRRIGAPRAAILATLEPVIGVLLAALLLEEIPSPLQIVGGVMILVAAVLLQLGGRRAIPVHEAAQGA